MARRRLTQIFPWLVPIRTAQRRCFFYMGMRLDGRQYAQHKNFKALPVCIYHSESKLLNPDTGFDMLYQYNKVYNLKRVVAPVNGLLIRPGETFSFWQAIRPAQRQGGYRDGLSIENGKLVSVPGGGICHLSYFLIRLFVHSPLTLVERHPHHIKAFPSPDADIPDGIEAAVSEGWLDLKVRNDTEHTFQLLLTCSDTTLSGGIYMDAEDGVRYRGINRDMRFEVCDGKRYETVTVARQSVEHQTGRVLVEVPLYTDRIEIAY